MKNDDDDGGGMVRESGDRKLNFLEEKKSSLFAMKKSSKLSKAKQKVAKQ